MSETKKNIAIGFVVIFAILVILRVLLFLHPSYGDAGFRFHAQFYDIEKIGKGSRVTYAGKPVGEVVKIAMLDRSAEKKGSLYSYDLTLAIDSHIKLYTTDEIALSTSGLMGERYIAIMPKATKDAKLLEPHGILYAAKTPSMIDIAQNVQSTVENLESITDIVNKPESLTKMMTHALQASENIASASQGIKDLVTKVSDGDGSLGRLIENDTLYFKAYSIMDKADTLMDDITQYGLLFHLSKGWQRAQKVKQQEFAKYSDPVHFQSLLLNEMQKISDSLQRLKMAIKTAENEKDQKEMQRAMRALSKDLERLQKESLVKAARD